MLQKNHKKQQHIQQPIKITKKYNPQKHIVHQFEASTPLQKLRLIKIYLVSAMFKNLNTYCKLHFVLKNSWKEQIN